MSKSLIEITSVFLGFFLTLFFSFLVSLNASAIEWAEPSFNLDLEAREYLQSLSQSEINPETHLSDQWLLVDSQLRQEFGSFQIQVLNRFWLTTGESRGLSVADPLRFQIMIPPRLFNLSSTLIDNSNTQVVSDFERLGVKWENETSEIYVGRRPLSLGYLSFFRVWNQFNFVPGQATWVFSQVFGSDLVSLSHTLEIFGLRAALHWNSVFGQNRNSDAHLLKMTLFPKKSEIHLLLGRWWNSTSLGVAGTLDFYGWALRLEQVTHFLASSSAETQLGLGAERAINDRWTLLVEAYYQSFGVNSDQPGPNGIYPLNLPSQFSPYRAQLYGFLSLGWIPYSLWKIDAGGFVNVIDKSRLILIGITRSMSDHFDVNLQGIVPWGGEWTEFSGKTFSIGPQISAGLGPQILVGMRASY